MRKSFLIVIGVLFMLNIQAQNDPNRKNKREQIKAAKVAFITNKLDLDSKTAQVFWPIFNEYEKEKSNIARKYYEQKRHYAKDRGDYSDMSEADANKMIEVYLAQKQAEAKIEKEYLPKFRTVLTAQQIWVLITSESEFRRSLMQRIGRSREGGRPGQNAPNKKGN